LIDASVQLPEDWIEGEFSSITGLTTQAKPSRAVTHWFGVSGESCFTLSVKSRFLQNLTKR
jgi:hypothetical protein